MDKEEEPDMYQREKETSREGRQSAGKSMQQVLLLFLVGFFVGAAFYYLFQNSFAGLLSPFENQLSSLPQDSRSLSGKMIQSVWNHGRFFLLFWLMSVTRIHKLYQSFFLLFTGFRNGFLILFFVFFRGPSGILLYLAGLFPHVLLFVPLYLFSFAWVGEKGHRREHKAGVCVLLALAFFAACFLEAKFNLPVMERVAGE